MADRYVLGFEDAAAQDVAASGGKGANLAILTQAGLPVPPGFIVTVAAYRWLAGHGLASDQQVVEQIVAAYRQLGGGPVAVRSSAVSEDATEASFAGQQETFLGICGEAALLEAVERCWQSLHTARAVAYRARQGYADADAAMAVVVQRMVPAVAAGVLFTRNPLDPQGETMLVEAAWGLGEAVVAGRVQPDRFVLDRRTGQVRSQQLGRKGIRITVQGEEAVPAEEQQQFCLDEAALRQLAALGRQVEELFGQPRDVEWAWADDRVYLLQARPITTPDAAEREQLRREEIARLQQLAGGSLTVWVRYNLSEVLPRPTPMSWSVVQRLVSARGGFGEMNRRFRAEPDPALGELSAFDLVAGRPMLNLARLPRMMGARPIFYYPLEQYRAQPHRALNPQPQLDPFAGRGWLRGLLALPATVVRLWRQSRTVRRLMADYPQRMAQVASAFATECQQALAAEWRTVPPKQLYEHLRRWIDRTLVEFAAESLQATVFAETSWNQLVAMLTPRWGAEKAQQAVGGVALGAKPPPEADLAAALRDVAVGRMSRQEFLERFGHRGPQEMELSQPRWAEQPEMLERLFQQALPEPSIPAGSPAVVEPPDSAKPSDSAGPSTPTGSPPAAGRSPGWERVADAAGLTGPWRDRFGDLLQQLHAFLGWREAGKHYLMMGYAVIRRLLVELDRRYGLRGGIFYLTLDDLPRLLQGEDLRPQIAAVRRRWQALQSLEVPAVLCSDDLDAIGRPVASSAAASWQGVPLSPGVAEGPALVLTTPPTTPPAAADYILVCPTTDPAWVPLFAHARGLVMEMGGVLSHGAIVAREFGLPAVAGLPGIVGNLRTGERLRIDGSTGQVVRLQPAGVESQPV